MTSEFSVGQHIGDYEILSILGAGGMGKVYKVRNVIADRVEAMKILLPDLNSNKSLADRFLREIRLLATLNHPNIASLRTAMTHENQLVMVMEFVEGETLSNRVARAPLSTAEVVNFADQALSALSYAHKQNIIHRDIKPANMMLTPQGVVKLMDFGIARSVTDHSLTSTGTTLGSLNYMPPEQVRGEAADARSDIYSFGVSLYEMLTGKLPFHGDSQYSLMSAHLNEIPPAPITLRADLPPGLNEIIMMAIAKNPNERFQSADAFRTALKSVQVRDLPPASLTSAPMSRPSTGATTLVDTPITSRVPTPLPTPPAPAPHSPATAATIPPTAAMTLPPPTPAAPPPPSTVAAPTPPLAGAPPAPLPPPSPRPAGSRTVWLALGAVIGVGVLIAAGMYVPRHFGTHADPSKATFPSSNTSAPPATPPAQDNSANPPSGQASGSDLKPDATGNASDTTSTTGSSATTPAKPERKDRSAGNPPPARSVPPPPQQPDAAPAPPPGPSPEEIEKVEDEADKLNVRAAAASGSVDTLRRQQQASGYNLRGDIAASQERMQLYLAKGDAALKSRDLKSAQKYFDLADAELSKLEKFLGH